MTPTEDHGGVEATARERWVARDNPSSDCPPGEGWWLQDGQGNSVHTDLTGDDAQAIAQAHNDSLDRLRAAPPSGLTPPPLESSRLDGNAGEQSSAQRLTVEAPGQERVCRGHGCCQEDPHYCLDCAKRMAEELAVTEEAKRYHDAVCIWGRALADIGNAISGVMLVTVVDGDTAHLGAPVYDALVTVIMRNRDVLAAARPHLAPASARSAAPKDPRARAAPPREASGGASGPSRAIADALAAALDEAFDLYSLGMSAGHALGPAPGDKRETKRIKTKMREALDAYEAIAAPTSPVAGAPEGPHES